MGKLRLRDLKLFVQSPMVRKWQSRLWTPKPSFLDFFLWGMGMDLPLDKTETWSGSTVLFTNMSSCQLYWRLQGLDGCSIPISGGLQHQLASVRKTSPSCCPRWDARPRSRVQIEHEFCWQGNNKASKSALGLFALHILVKLHVRD